MHLKILMFTMYLDSMLYPFEFKLDFSYRIQASCGLTGDVHGWLIDWLSVQAVGNCTNNKHCSPTTMPQARSTKQQIHSKK